MGLQLTAQGHLSFFMNGLNQGVAAEGVYQEDWDMFCFVEMTEGCEAIEVTRASEEQTVWGRGTRGLEGLGKGTRRLKGLG